MSGRAFWLERGGWLAIGAALAADGTWLSVVLIAIAAGCWLWLPRKRGAP